MDSMLYDLLATTGGVTDILEAMKGKDLADVVRAAMAAMKVSLAMPRQSERKSADISNDFREQGNHYYRTGDYQNAIEFYNRALACAPKNSLEIKLAYSNISAVLLTIGAYEACQTTIKACLGMDCPKFLTDKLHRRMSESNKFVDAAIARDRLVREGDDFLKNYLNFDVKRNPEVPCASEDVRIVTTDGSKEIVAARDIKAGTMVALERAFVSTQGNYRKYTSCYYCHRICFFFIPCEGCSHALFCSEECRKKCLEEYHRVECRIIPFMGVIYDEPRQILITRAAIKMSLELGWDKLKAASLEIGLQRLKKSTVKEACDVSNPLSMLCYDDRACDTTDKIFQGSLKCAPAVHFLTQVPGYFPAGAKKKEAVDAISRIMLHLFSTFTNRIEILSSAYDFKVGVYKCAAQRNTGWFSFASKLPHSCEPNLLALGLNDQVALIALQTIKKGDKLNISYVDHFYDTSYKGICQLPRARQMEISNAIRQHCVCRVCTQEWNNDSHVAANLTADQKKVFEKFNAIVQRGDVREVGKRFKAATEVLDSFTGLMNKTQHRRVYHELRSALNIIQVACKCNKAYGVVPPTRTYTANDEKIFKYRTS